MGGFFGVVGKQDAVEDVFYGTDYHSHLGTKRGGMAVFDIEKGLQRSIHNIENAPFRTKFHDVFEEMKGTSAIGCISDTDPQPLLIRSKLGTYAICVTGVINNSEELISEYMNNLGGHFDAMTGGRVNSAELVAALINEKESFAEGIRYAQEKIQGTAAIIILRDNGNIIAARDYFGRLPMLIGKNDNGFSVSFESFSHLKLGYKDERELGPAEIVELTPDTLTVIKEAREEMHICSFLWSYYGYPTSCYEGVNVEAMRNRNGEIMFENDKENGTLPKLDFVCGVPDSGTPHAIGYANKSDIRFARPFIKYTPTWSKSFTPSKQSDRNKIAKMKMIPVHELIEDKELMFVDDSIVRGTQLRETVDFLYENGAKAVHIRSACPPIMYGCKFLNFSRGTSDMDLIARKTIYELEGDEGEKYIEEYSNPKTERGKKLRKTLAEKMHFASLEFQTLEGIEKAIGIDKCKLCTYCWNGKE